MNDHRIRVMLNKNKMERIVEHLLYETDCDSITHLIHCLLQWVDQHPSDSEPIKEG